MKTPAFYTQEELKAAGVSFDHVIDQEIFNAISEAFPDKEIYGWFVTVYRPGSMLGFIQPTSWEAALIWSQWDGKVYRR